MEDYEHSLTKDFVYLLGDEMLDDHLPRIEVVDKDKVFKDEDRHKHRTVRRHHSERIHNGYGVPIVDDTRTV